MSEEREGLMVKILSKTGGLIAIHCYQPKEEIIKELGIVVGADRSGVGYLQGENDSKELIDFYIERADIACVTLTKIGGGRILRVERDTSKLKI